MKTSCISHPPKTPLVIIREEYLAICDGDHCEAAILNQFEYWTNIKLGYKEQAEVEGEIARAGGIEVSPSDLWIYKSQTELHEELMRLFGIRAVGTALQSLVDRGFLERRNNPKYAWDRTYQYRLHTTKVQDAILQKCKLEKSDAQPQKARKRDIEPDEIETALPETTTEITPKGTTKKETADFPKKPKAPSPDPGGDPDSGKEQGNEKVEAGHHPGHSAGDSGLRAGADSPSETFSDSGGMRGRDDDRTDTGVDPLMMPFERRTAAARAEAGNYADTAQAGGGDGFRDGPVDAFCEVLVGISSLKLPPNLRKSWGDKLREIAKKCNVTPEIMERAIRAIPDDKIGWKTFSSPYADKFEDNIIPLLLRDGQPRQKGDRHGPHQHNRIAQGAVRREVASEEEARAILGDRYRGP